jgi:hypothetical protein
MKWYIGLAAFGFAVLACAAVWFGGLNQDEGWYLYAANLVAEGRLPYRDFFFTQGPVMPIVYSAFAGVWRSCGILGARILTLAMGLAGIMFASGLAARLAPAGRRAIAAMAVFLLLACNLYHLYYLAIPKTYALAGLFAMAGFYLLSFEGVFSAIAAGLCLAFAAGTRISLGVLLAVAGVWLVFRGSRLRWLFFGLAGALGLILVYGPFLVLGGEGSRAALAYHAARGGFDVAFTAGSLSRLVRWYLPVFVLLGLGVASGGFRTVRPWLPALAFCAAFVVHLSAPFPYEDYQVPVMGLLAVAAAVSACDLKVAGRETGVVLLVLGMTWACSFGSPLLEGWTTNGHDRFWSLRKQSSELAQLRSIARDIESLDPGGKTLLTQDTYLAIETRRSVPLQMSMGPFSYWGDGLPYDGADKVVLDYDGMRALLDSAPCEIAAMSGYAFAIDAPTCRETDMDRQLEFWGLLKRRYNHVFTEYDFGQHATPLMVLKRKHGNDAR